jgi:signal peptide peptidase SppA
MKYSIISALIFDEPLMITPVKLETILSVVAERENLSINAEEQTAMAQSEALSKSGDVAIIPITGSLTHRPTGLSAMSGLANYEQMDAQLDAAMNDSRVTEIVLDMNSPGGMVSGLFDFADRISAAKQHKPITAIVNESAYSAAYLIASAATEIIVPRTAGVGSIGVITAHVDKSQANEKEGKKVTYITAGARKADGNPDEPLSDDALQTIQSRVNASYELFVEAVASNRGLDASAVRATEAGVYIGSAAIEAGLADKVMSAKDAMQMILARNNSTPNGSGRTVSRRARAISLTP